MIYIIEKFLIVLDFCKKNIVLRKGLTLLMISKLVLLTVSCRQKKEYTTPQIQSLTESVYSSVTIQPDSLYNVFSAVGGIVNEVFVAEGDLVKKGEDLVGIENTTSRINTQNAKLTLELKKANYQGKAALISELKQDLYNASLKFANDSINYERQKHLWKKEIGSKKEVEGVQLAYEIAKSNLQIAENKLSRTELELANQLNQAHNNYKNSLVSTNNFTVKSKISGKIYELLKDPGEMISIQEPIASIGSSTDFIIEMSIDEVDITRIKVGQKIVLALDAYEGLPFDAMVHKIYPTMNMNSQTFLVEGRFLKQPDLLYAGLTGEANIIVNTKPSVLTIPIEYLVDNETVLTVNGKKKVVTGLKNLNRIEIILGLDTNTQLIKPEQ
jgi:HlyD family secretion protein